MFFMLNVLNNEEMQATQAQTLHTIFYRVFSGSHVTECVRVAPTFGAFPSQTVRLILLSQRVGLLKSLSTGDFFVDMIGKVSQDADAVLHRLQRGCDRRGHSALGEFS